MTRGIGHLFVVAAAASCAGIARADDPGAHTHGRPQDSIVATASEIPDNVDLLIVMKDARGFVRSEVGRTLIDIGVRMAGFTRTRTSWGALAQELGMGSDEAVDALLANRTVVAARWTDRGGIAWALEAELSPDMERRIERALKPAPREIIGGRPVLGVEGGTMEMILARTPSGSRMLLGPTNEPSLFLELAAALDEPPAAPLARSNLFREIARVGRNADGLVLYRSPGRQDAWFAAALDQAPNELKVAFLVGVPGMEERGRDIEPWSRQTFDRISADAYLAVLDLNQFTWGEGGGQGGGQVGGESGGIRLLSGLGLPLDLPADVVAQLSDRFALVIRDSASGPVDVALALETMDTTAMSRAGDRWLCTTLRGMSRDQRFVDRLGGLEEMPPTAVRCVDLAQAMGTEGPIGGWTTGPHVSWGARIDRADCNADQHHGWWAVGLGPATVQELGRSVSEEGEEPGISMPWLSLGVARPAALVKRLEDNGIMMPPLVDPLRKIEEIRWAAMESGRGVVQGYGHVVVGEKEATSEAGREMAK